MKAIILLFGLMFGQTSQPSAVKSTATSKPVNTFVNRYLSAQDRIELNKILPRYKYDAGTHKKSAVDYVRELVERADTESSRTAVYHSYGQYKSAADTITKFCYMASHIANAVSDKQCKVIAERLAKFLVSSPEYVPIFNDLSRKAKAQSLLAVCIETLENEVANEKRKVEEYKRIVIELKKFLNDAKDSRKAEQIQVNCKAIVDRWLKDLESGVASQYESPSMSAHPINPKSHRILQWSYDILRQEYVVLVDVESTNKASMEIRNRWVVGTRDGKVSSFQDDQKYEFRPVADVVRDIEKLVK